MKKIDFVRKVTDIVRSIENEDGEQVFDVTLKETDAYMFAFKEAILDLVKNGDELVWQGLVKFYVGDQAARTSRNPRTGETIQVPAKKKAKVKILSELKSAV